MFVLGGVHLYTYFILFYGIHIIYHGIGFMNPYMNGGHFYGFHVGKYTNRFMDGSYGKSSEKFLIDQLEI